LALSCRNEVEASTQAGLYWQLLRGVHGVLACVDVSAMLRHDNAGAAKFLHRISVLGGVKYWKTVCSAKPQFRMSHGAVRETGVSRYICHKIESIGIIEKSV
jgi:hypothetical protein